VLWNVIVACLLAGGNSHEIFIVFLSFKLQLNKFPTRRNLWSSNRDDIDSFAPSVRPAAHPSNHKAFMQMLCAGREWSDEFMSPAAAV